MDGGVSTSMDQLVGLLEKKDNIKINDAAKELDTDKEHVESWTRMLEKAGLIELHYSVIGGAFIKRGPKFDTVAKGGVKGVEGSKESGGEEPKEEHTAQEAPKEGEEEKPKEAEKKETPPKKPEAAGDMAGDYRLIRKEILEEETAVEEELKKLQSEEEKVVEYMNALIDEGKKLTEYIEALSQILEQLQKEKDTKPGHPAKNPLGTKATASLIKHMNKSKKKT